MTSCVCCIFSISHLGIYLAHHPVDLGLKHAGVYLLLVLLDLVYFQSNLAKFRTNDSRSKHIWILFSFAFIALLAFIAYLSGFDSHNYVEEFVYCMCEFLLQFERLNKYCRVSLVVTTDLQKMFVNYLQGRHQQHKIL